MYHLNVTLSGPPGSGWRRVTTQNATSRPASVYYSKTNHVLPCRKNTAPVKHRGTNVFPHRSPHGFLLPSFSISVERKCELRTANAAPKRHRTTSCFTCRCSLALSNLPAIKLLCNSTIIIIIVISTSSTTIATTACLKLVSVAQKRVVGKWARHIWQFVCI